MARERFVYIFGESDATVIYGGIGLATLVALHAEPRHAFVRLVHDARFVFQPPELEGILLSTPSEELGAALFPAHVFERICGFTEQFLAPTPGAGYCVGALLAMSLLRADVDAALIELRTGGGLGSVVYRALTYGERPTTFAERAFVADRRALFKGLPRRRVLKIQNEGVIWAEVHEFYRGNLDDALEDGLPGWDKPRLSRAIGPFYRAFGMPLSRGPRGLGRTTRR